MHFLGEVLFYFTWQITNGSVFLTVAIANAVGYPLLIASILIPVHWYFSKAQSGFVQGACLAMFSLFGLTILGRIADIFFSDGVLGGFSDEIAIWIFILTASYGWLRANSVRMHLVQGLAERV